MFGNFAPRSAASPRDVRPVLGVVVFGALLIGIGTVGLVPAAAQSQSDVVVAIPSKGGAVEGSSQNSDEFVWNLVTQFGAPVDGAQGAPTFETWASDADTFAVTPHWPGPGVTHNFTASRLGLH